CELWYGALDEPVTPEGTVEYVLEEYESENEIDSWTLDQRQEWVSVSAKLTAIFPAYTVYWSKADADFKWLEREDIFKVPMPVTLRNGKEVEVPITGMRDGLVEKKKSRLVFETKTKGRINYGGISNTVLFDFQCNLYLWAANRTHPGVSFSGFIYNLIHTSNLRINVKNDGPEFVERLQKHIKQNPGNYF